MFDLIVIGAGPAGVSAAVYARSRGLKVLVLEGCAVGGLIGRVSTVTHYAGVTEGESGAAFARRLASQLESTGALVKNEQVVGVCLEGREKCVTTENGIYKAYAVVLAAGTTPRALGIPGEQELAGRGIGLNAARDAERFRGRNCWVIGGSDGAVKEAVWLTGFAKKVTVVHFEDRLGAVCQFTDLLKTKNNAEVLTGTRLAAVRGRDRVEVLELADEKNGRIRQVEDDGCGIFVYAGAVPNTALFGGLRQENGYLCVGGRMETSVPGVYAAGDIVAKQVRQVATAVSDGAVAAINACAYLAGARG